MTTYYFSFTCLGWLQVHPISIQADSEVEAILRFQLSFLQNYPDAKWDLVSEDEFLEIEAHNAFYEDY